MTKIIKKEKKKIRHKRVRSKVFGTASRPRLCVFKSNKHIYANIIDDEKGVVLINTSDNEIKTLKEKTKSIAYQIGKLIAEKAKKKDILLVVFDRSGYNYHGKIKDLATGARDAGLKF